MEHKWRVITKSIEWCENCGTIKQKHEEYIKLILPKSKNVIKKVAK